MTIEASESLIFCKTPEVNYFTEPPWKYGRSDIKLFKIELSAYDERIDYLKNFLAPHEIERAEKYHFKKDKNRFIICRALLKFLLANHINLDINKINIEVDSYKKPYLPNRPSVYFNVSHAGDYGLIVIAKHLVGIDIEYINKEFDYKEILQNVFHQNEIDVIKTSKDQHHTFYKFWTRKEAIVKAIGKGIDDDLKNIPITDGLHSVPSALIFDFNKINVFSFNLNDAYVGTLAVTEDLNNFHEITFCPIPPVEKLKSIIAK